MGMFSNFVAGAAGTGATLLSQESLDDAKTNADLLKAQRVMDMQATQNEKLRVAGADRVKLYFAPTTENVAGAATAVDDDDNPTSPNDYTKSSPASLQLAAQRAGEAGDLASVSSIHAMSDKDERIEAIRQRSLDWAQSRDDATKAKVAIANQANETKLFFGTDSEGHPIAKGPGSGAINSQLNTVTQQQKIFNGQIAALDKMMDNPILTPERLKILTARQDQAVKDLADANKNYKEVSDRIFHLAESSTTGTSGAGGSGAPGAIGAMPPGLNAAQRAEWFKNIYNGNMGGAIAQLKNGSSDGDSPVAAKTPTAKVTPVAATPVVPAAGMMQEPVGPPVPTAAQMASNPLNVQVDKELQEMNLGKRFTFSSPLVKDAAKTMQDERDKRSAEQNQIDLLAQAARLKQFNSSAIENARAEALAQKGMRD